MTLNYSTRIKSTEDAIDYNEIDIGTVLSYKVDFNSSSSEESPYWHC